MTKEKSFTVTIDNQKVEVKSSLTILEAAREHNIYIPSLCALEKLPSYGACRMCIVEVDGLRGFPTACTTPVEEGMVIRTDSAEIKGLRQEILKLVLSEHPGSCLFCGEKEECMQFQGTIRKAGVTTGCRYCPNDGRCELQQITEKVGLTETSYPVHYRNFALEKDDPFYDRDYNLCVLCGRCIRICSTVRMNGTLSFKQRGKLTTIGPAFNRSHMEGGCEFCGACVSVCPTGTLSVKTSKWFGKPERETASTCPYCSIGCRLLLQVKHNEVIDALPDYASSVDHGLVCVKGRFAVPEFVNSPLRLTRPQMLGPLGYEVVSWDRAVDEAVKNLAGAPPDDFLMLVSPQLSNEDLFVAQQFTRQVMGTDNIAAPLLVELGDGAASFLGLACSSEPLESVDKADFILAVGFDSRYGYSPAGVRIKKAAEKGVGLFVLNNRDTNLDMLSEAAFTVKSSDWTRFLQVLSLTKEDKKKKTELQKDSRFSDLFSRWEDEMERLQDKLTGSNNNVMVIGPEVLAVPERNKILQAVKELRDSAGWKIIVAHPYTNLSGMVVMGALQGIKPGEAVLKNASRSSNGRSFQVSVPDMQKHWKIIYLMGEACPEWLPPHDYLIYQNAFPPSSSCQPNLILPSALFTESVGTMVNVEGRLLHMDKAVEPPGESRPDWWVMGRLGEKLDGSSVAYTDVFAIHMEMKKYAKTFPDIKKRIAFAPFLSGDTGKGGPVRDSRPAVRPDVEDPFAALTTDRKQEYYRGLALSDAVPGMKQIGERGDMPEIHREERQ